MKYGLSTIAFKEERYIVPFLKHIPDWVDEKIALHSIIPWNGEVAWDDKTASLARPYAEVISSDWSSEESQRNSGQELHTDKDWVIVLDPDEFLDHENWRKLKDFLETTTADAVVVEGQFTYWRDDWVADPPRDYQMLIAARPHVKFVDKRVVNTGYAVVPVWLHHMSWRKTDEEIWSKISHYAHAKDFDIEKWYKEKWLAWKPGMKDVHPTTPETLHDFKKANLPKELKELGI